MNIYQFKYVLAVVDLRNFELAAERCFVTQSTLSTMIARFEAEIGVRLFNRKTRPVSVTPEGRVIIERLRILENEVGALANAVQELKGEMSGELRLGIIPTIAPYLLPLFVEDFTKKFPRVNFFISEMTTAQIEAALRSRELDIGVVALPLHNPELEETVLFSEPFLVYDCTGKKTAGKIALKNLDYNKLCLLQEGHCLRTQVNKLCELSHSTLRSDMNFTFDSGSMDSLLRITRLKKGITIVPFIATLDWPEAECRRLIEFRAPVYVRTVGLVSNKHFVKQKLLSELKKSIVQITRALIPLVKNRQNIQPV